MPQSPKEPCQTPCRTNRVPDDGLELGDLILAVGWVGVKLLRDIGPVGGAVSAGAMLVRAAQLRNSRKIKLEANAETLTAWGTMLAVAKLGFIEPSRQAESGGYALVSDDDEQLR